MNLFEAVFGSIGRVLDWFVAQFICATTGCTPNGSFTRCVRCGWDL